MCLSKLLIYKYNIQIKCAVWCQLTKNNSLRNVTEHIEFVRVIELTPNFAWLVVVVSVIVNLFSS